MPLPGSLAQTIAVAAHGQLCLAQPDVPPPELLGGNSAFELVGDVQLTPVEGPPFRGTREWYSHLRASGATAFWLGRSAHQGSTPEREAIAFAGSDPWLVKSDLPDRLLLWSPLWRVTRSDAPDPEARSRMWSVEYRAWTVPEYPDVRFPVDACRYWLEHALREIAAFARETNSGSWAATFEDALATLQDGRTEMPRQADLLPDRGYSHEARVLLAGAARAWVFGGMGSWNDQGFSEKAMQQRYEEVSDHLYGSVMNACLAAVNSFDVALV